MGGSDTLTNHRKTIIHIDMDCFYAQVELLKQPHLLNEPVGVKQKSLLVTCNYEARKFGVRKCMSVSEALKICPNLILFNGENLCDYREASNKIHSFLLSFTNKVEKCGFDENYLDVSELVSEKESRNEIPVTVVGHCLGDVNDCCPCGCHKRLLIGSEIAQEIRIKLRSDLGYTSCCGISSNKLLAKLSCSSHKPNQQTTLLPNGREAFMLALDEVGKIPGIGGKTKEILESIGIRTVKDLREADIKILKEAFKNEKMVAILKNLSFGVCESEVKTSQMPMSIGLEEGSQKISVVGDVRQRFRTMLERLMVLVGKDGRIPATIKVTVRNRKGEKIGNKETKQSPVPASLVSHRGNPPTEDSLNKLLEVIMGLFCRMVDVSKPFLVSLLGLSFSKFHEKDVCSSVAPFLLKKKELSSQTLTDIEWTDESSRRDTSETVAPCGNPTFDLKAEPPAKKKKFDFFSTFRKPKDSDSGELNSPRNFPIEMLSKNSESYDRCPPHVDPEVFRELPLDLRKEIITDWKVSQRRSKPNQNKQSLLYSYCIPKSSR